MLFATLLTYAKHLLTDTSTSLWIAFYETHMRVIASHGLVSCKVEAVLLNIVLTYLT
jgi:hypothetical protein